MPDNYTITLTAAEVDTIGIALGEIPLKTGLSLWLSLKEQVKKQQSVAREEIVNGIHTFDNNAG